MEYTFAAVEDGEEISAMLESVEFKGEISLAYCRRPNAVLSLARDGEKSAFIIGRDKDGKLVGFGGCVINNGVAYLTGLRATAQGNIPRCYKMMREFCAENNAKTTYTTILKDNVVAQKMFEKRRKSMPYYLRHSELVTNIIRKNLRVKDRNKMVLQDGFYVLKNPAGEELARGKAVSQWDYKQYVVKHYGWKLRAAKRFFKWIPDVDEVLKFYTLREVTAANTAALDSFLRHFSRQPGIEGNFFLYGGDCPVKSIKYRSIVYIVDWEKTITDVSKIKLDVEISDL